MNSRARRLASQCCLLVALSLVGCSKGNPLLGKWEIDKEASSRGMGLAAMFGGGEVEFLSDKVMMGSTGASATYEVGDDYVLVTTNGQATKYVIVSSDRIRLDLPMENKIVYQRVE